VLGTAGSGKTTLALHRAAYLANPATDHAGRTLLVTFNKCLVAYLQALGGRLGNVGFRNYHHFARGYLARRGKMANNAIASPDLAAGFGQQAVDGVKKLDRKNKRHPALPVKCRCGGGFGGGARKSARVSVLACGPRRLRV